MPNARVAFYAPNGDIHASFRRLARNLDVHRYHIIPNGLEPPAIEFEDPNFFFGAIAGTKEEVWKGVRMAQFAQTNLRPMVGHLPMAILADSTGYEAWKKAGLNGNYIRLVIRVCVPGNFPDVGSLVAPHAKTTDVRSFTFTEDEGARVCAMLTGALRPPSFG